MKILFDVGGLGHHPKMGVSEGSSKMSCKNSNVLPLVLKALKRKEKTLYSHKITDATCPVVSVKPVRFNSD